MIKLIDILGDVLLLNLDDVSYIKVEQEGDYYNLKVKFKGNLAEHNYRKIENVDSLYGSKRTTRANKDPRL